MGYDLHITRRENWFDEDGAEITSHEWLTYVASDKSMVLAEKAEAMTDGGDSLAVSDPTLAVWTGWAGREPDQNEAWMWHFEGCVVAKNPDQAIRQKMFLIADELGARLQGDDGEFYESDGEPEKKRKRSKADRPARPWWKFW